MGAIFYTSDKEAAWVFLSEHYKVDRKRCLILEREDDREYKVADLHSLTEYSADLTEFQKVCIIPDADFLSEIVQNKLLKLIEDSDVDFYLFSSSADQLLPTIKSRLCQFYIENGQANFSYFSGLTGRREILGRVPVHKKEYKMPLSAVDFIRNTEEVFLSAYIHPENVSGLWSEDEIYEVCSICEEYEKKPLLTKDDLFSFLISVIGV